MSAFALLLVVAIIGYNGLNNMAAATDHIVHEALPEVEEVKDLEFQLACRQSCTSSTP